MSGETMKQYLNRIGGRDLEPTSGRWMESINPYTGQAWCRIPASGPEDAELAVQAAHRAFTDGEWSAMKPSRRGALLRKLADAIAAQAEALAHTEVRDNGKLLSEMLGQLRYIPEWFHYYGGLADKVEGSVLPIDKDGYFAFTRKEPLGVVAAITAWNSPLLLLTWKLAPGLAAGNTFVVKPSEFASASTLEFARLIDEVGFPPGVVNVVTGNGVDVGPTLVGHPDVAKVAFTGSDATGRHINQQAARDFKHVTMELGGKSPNIVFEDADLDAAAAGAISGIFAAAGQTCMAGSRLLVQASVQQEFVRRLVALAAQARIGDPLDPRTDIGPMANAAQFEKVKAYIAMARAEGAELVLGGEAHTAGPSPTPLFIQPTIFNQVSNRMRIAQEEVFGPVLAVIPFKDEQEAIAIANDTLYGLAAGVWTQDVARGLRCAQRIAAGTVWINSYRAVSYMAPFGGVKRSGIGRESGQEMINEYLQTKTIWVNTGAQVSNPFVMR